MTSNEQTKTITVHSYKNINPSIGETNILNFTQISSRYLVINNSLKSKKLLDSSSKDFSIPLKLVDKSKLEEIRNSKFSYLIYKNFENYYIAKIPKDMRITSSVLPKKHLCANHSKVCKKLDSLKEFGCDKVLDYNSKIENYPWITNGFESINVEHPAFIVCNCKLFKLF